MSDTNINPETELLFEQPYKQIQPEFQTLRLDELVAVNLDIPAAVTTVVGACPEVFRLVPQIEKELPLFDVASLKKLELYAMALSHANTLYYLASQPSDPLQPLAEEGTRLREVLVADATALVQRGFLDGNRLKELRGSKGYKNLTFDLQLLAAWFRENFEKVASKSGIQLDELLRAEQIAARIVRAAGLREQGTASIAETSDNRIRAFTLFMRWYDQARRAVSFLRWNEDDVESIAPSLFAGRGGRKRNETDIPPATTAPTDTAASAAAPTAPTGGPAPASGASTPAAPAAPGAPSPHPFLS